MGAGQGAVGSRTGTCDAMSPICSPRDPALLVGLLELPRFWGACVSAASRGGAEGTKKPAGAYKLFIKKSSIMDYLLLADTDCKRLVPWLLVNYVICKLLLS